MNNVKREWHIKDESDKPLKEKILRLRHISKSEENTFLHPQLSDLSDPFLFHDMEKAVERVQQAIEHKERIVVFGDYDVDGVTGTAILVRTLLKLKANVSYRLPHRVQDGYGLKSHFIDDIHDKNATLLVTVDNGIASHKEVDYAKEKGIDVIITDHHRVSDKLPKAFAIIHPGIAGEPYPFKHLSGSGVAFMFAKALMKKLANDRENIFVYDMLDIVALGTVADCVPLLGENRILVWHGMKQLPHTKSVGLQHLMHVAEVKKEKIDTHTIEYIIAPRLNAGGRMETAMDALHLFLFSDEQGKELAQKLHRLNSQRQLETQKIFEEAEQKLEREGAQHIIILEGDWHIGVIGIVASKLAEKYFLPTIILGKKDDRYVASCRSEGVTNIIELLSHFKEYFIHYGGHEGAAGFEMEEKKYSSYKKAMETYLDGREKHPSRTLPFYIDAVITGQDITWDLYDFISKLEPFGEGNPKPLFMLEGGEVKNIRLVGNNKHVKLLLKSGGTLFEGIAFLAREEWKGVHVGDIIDIACEIEENEFNGNRKLDLIIRDIKEII